MGGTIEPSASGGALETADDDPVVESLPKEAGLFLLMIGIGGLLLPGPVGTPFLVMSVMVFFPKAFTKVDQGFKSRFPNSHRQGMKQVRRFVDDLERRYPSHI